MSVTNFKVVFLAQEIFPFDKDAIVFIVMAAAWRPEIHGFWNDIVGTTSPIEITLGAVSSKPQLCSAMATAFAVFALPVFYLVNTN